MTEQPERVVALAKLRAPFPSNQISKLPKPYKKDSPKGKCNECGGYHGLPAVHLDYVGHAALTDRLLDVDLDWTWEPLAFAPDGQPAFDRIGGLWIRLTVCGVTRLGYGSADGKSGGDAVKEIIGDALRNAAMRFGAALELWHKGDLHVDDGDDTPRQDAPRHDPAPPPPAEPLITAAQVQELMTDANAAGVDAKTLCEVGNIPSVKDMPAAMFAECKVWIAKRAKARQTAASRKAEPILDDSIPF